LSRAEPDHAIKPPRMTTAGQMQCTVSSPVFAAA